MFKMSRENLIQENIELTSIDTIRAGYTAFKQENIEKEIEIKTSGEIAIIDAIKTEQLAQRRPTIEPRDKSQESVIDAREIRSEIKSRLENLDPILRKGIKDKDAKAIIEFINSTRAKDFNLDYSFKVIKQLS